MIRSLNFPNIDLSIYTEYKDYPVHLERLNWLYKIIQETRSAEKKNISIIDVGCGTGNITVPLGYLPDASILGIDLDEQNIAVSSQRNNRPNVTIQFAYLQDCSLEKVDYIILTEVLEHIPNYEDILDYIGKNAKEDFRLLITIPNGWGPFEISQTPLYWMRKMGLNGFIRKVKKWVGKKEPYATNQEETPHVNFFTQTQLKRSLDRVGLEITRFDKAFVFSPVLETYTPFISLKSFAYYDNVLAQKLPRMFASGWYLEIQKKKR